MANGMIKGVNIGQQLLGASPCTIQLRTKDCPDHALSCTKYDDCCVPSYGKLVLAQFWLVEQPEDMFTVHGLWPGNCQFAKAPREGCPISPQFVGEMSSIMVNDRLLKTNMDKYWVSPGSSRYNSRFWKGEWNKHGTCLSTVRKACHPADTEVDAPKRYFQVTLNTYFQYDVFNELKNNQIVPRLAPYTRAELMNGLGKWAGSVTLQCDRDGHILQEVRFTLLGMARDRFTPRKQERENSCKEDEVYYLPKGTRNFRVPSKEPPQDSTTQAPFTVVDISSVFDSGESTAPESEETLDQKFQHHLKLYPSPSQDGSWDDNGDPNIEL